MNLKTATLFTILMVSGTAASGLAQSTGTVTLTIEGEERIIPISGGSEWYGGETRPYISLDARALDDNGREELVMGLGFDAPRWDASAPEMTLWRFEDGELVQRLRAYQEEERGALTVTLDNHELDGTTLKLTGRLEGTLGTSENRGADIDLSDGVPVVGTFSVTLEQLD
jgi:hypothetical protein